MNLSPEHLEELRQAKRLLERPGIASRLTSVLGAPIEKGIKLLPGDWSSKMHSAVELSLRKALEAAVMTLGNKPRRARNVLHKAAAVGSGGVGGAFGLAALPVELPLSTGIMLRSVADIARSQGENLDDMETRLSCLQVFALGGHSDQDDAAETGYYALRAVLASTLSEAAAFVAQRGLTKEGAPALVRFITVIASRFSTVVSEKVAAMAIPAIGAVGGAVINGIFMNHFQNVARGHFTVRRLERLYGAQVVEDAYAALDRPTAEKTPK